jgi:hypothetical protein
MEPDVLQHMIIESHQLVNGSSPPAPPRQSIDNSRYEASNDVRLRLSVQADIEGYSVHWMYSAFDPLLLCNLAAARVGELGRQCLRSISRRPRKVFQMQCSLKPIAALAAPSFLGIVEPL